jgi:uncharacterized protein (DUF302 family)
MTPDGLIEVASRHGPDETIARLRAAVIARGMTVMALIDHAAGAREAGLTLRPTTVLIFGNARAGTPLMAMSETIGLDLPLRVLVREKEDGKTWLVYADPAATAARHGIADAPVLAAMAQALAAVTAEAGD